MEENTLPEFTGQSCDWYDVPCHLSGFAEWLLNVLLFIPRKIFELLMDSLASVLEAIPALDAVTQASSAMGAIASMGYIANIVALKEGVALLMVTMLARFLLRRIPFIG